MATQTKAKPKPQANKPKGKGGKGFLAFLQRKEMGLPIWAWALIIAFALFLFYRRLKGGGGAKSSTPSTATDQTAPDTSGAGDFSGSGGGGSSPSDTSGDLSNTQPFGSGFELPYGYGGFGQGFPTDFSTLPDGTNPTATTPVGGVGPLNWGNEHFTSRKQFESWLTSRGGSIASFRVSHPAAYAHYLALPSGKSKVKATKKTTAKAGGTVRSGTTSPISKARKAIATGVSGGGTPRKTSVRTIAKAPLTGVSHTITQAGSNGRVSALHPSTLTGGSNPRTKVAPKSPTATKTPKVAAKPKPVAHPVVTKPSRPSPPKKARK